jgi:hypothetical protein
MTERVINIAIFHGGVLLVAEGKLVRFKYPINNNHLLFTIQLAFFNAGHRDLHAKMFRVCYIISRDRIQIGVR